ncbi:hypothetical protein [Arthrobacter bambusae]|uniref:Uncharacterized protein n=1 Tax=Arthrobacter bambusae TaxID=1338426 RepID=A0AAW8DDF4_9MICC|nr:hypothetical protein [Arthrobacter bambusae]MDP9903204.1 hypothetical protein [Arthrobacter bambusae]MDQ0128802.1 hypothetical protein [Arthrobacter bambusae]MDQ0180143.1 hypothetical protein [Arthrobacter bambusae]
MTKNTDERADGAGHPRLRDLRADELNATVKARVDRLKIDPEKLAARREQRRIARAEQKGRPKKTIRLSVEIGIALIVVAGACVAATNVNSDQTQQVSAANAQKIEELTAHVNYLEATGASAKDSGLQAAKTAEAELNGVREKANEVASLQNEFTTLLAAHPANPGNGAPSQGFLDSVKHRAKLAPYFSPGTYLLDAAGIASQGSDLGLASGQIDPRLPWYQGKLEAGVCSWEAVSVTPNAGGSPSLTDVTWLCRDSKTDDLLAWASGSWSKDIKAFVSLKVGTTSLGDQRSTTAPAGPDQNTTMKGGA